MATSGQGLTVDGGVRTRLISASLLTAAAVTSKGISSSHLGITGRASSQEMVGRLAAEGGLTTLSAATPLVLNQGAGVKVHEHVSIEVACCK